MSARSAWRDEVAGSLRAIVRQAEANARDQHEAVGSVDESVRAVADVVDRIEAALAVATSSDPVVDAYDALVIRRSVIVNLLNGSAIRGVLTRADGPLLELSNAEYISADAETNAARIDGRAVVERSRVEFLQII